MSAILVVVKIAFAGSYLLADLQLAELQGRDIACGSHEIAAAN